MFVHKFTGKWVKCLLRRSKNVRIMKMSEENFPSWAVGNGQDHSHTVRLCLRLDFTTTENIYHNISSPIMKQTLMSRAALRCEGDAE